MLRRREAFTADATAFAAAWKEAETTLASAIVRAEALLAGVRVPDDLYGAIGALCLKVGTGSHRADITLLQCAKAIAAFQERELVAPADIVEAGELALGHRLPVDPFAPTPTITRNDVARALDDILHLGIEEKKAPRPARAAQREAST